MEPFANRIQWNLRGRPYHLIEGLRRERDRLDDAKQGVFDQRVKMMDRALRANLTILVVMYFGIFATLISWLARYFAAATEVAMFVDTLAKTFSGTTAVVAIIFLLIRRRIGQLEADLVALCISYGSCDGPKRKRAG